MNARQLLYSVKLALEVHSVDEESPVLISLRDPSLGPRAAVEVASAGSGIDLEHGQFRIEPAEKLYRNILRMEEPAGIVRESFGGVVFNACGNCHRKVAKDDRFCRHCGQRLK